MKEQKNFYIESFEASYREKTGKDFNLNLTSAKPILLLLSSSVPISNFLIKHPDFADVLSKSYMKDLLFENYDKYLDIELSPKEALYNYKYTILSILTAKYLAHQINTEEFGRLWSNTAARCCEFAYQAAFKELCTKYGTPENYSFTVIALGKLGACELNYSSDIDLLYLYNRDDSTVGDISFHEFSCKLAANITSILSTIKNNCFCFRVDTDLRPEGKSGTLANSIDAAINYYQYWGQEWERMMLIRANPIAGDIELGQKFITFLKPFIYRKTWDINALIKIKESKEKIETEALKSSESGFNIKLGQGGIREIEFIVQTLQILHGGKSPALINNNTLCTLRELNAEKIITSKQFKELQNAYNFLRLAENMVQLPEEKQVHTFPTKDHDKQSLALRMGYSDSNTSNVSQILTADLAKHRDNIKQYFQFIFETDFTKHEMEQSIYSNISTCTNIEEEIDSLAWFKSRETKKIQFLDLEKGAKIQMVSKKLSLIAEVVLSESYKIASNFLRKSYGPPISDKDGNTTASMAIIGLGKLGSREIDYASDLDIMFIYSDDGKTTGPKIISNLEYFTKLSQRIISLVSTSARYGKAYKIDTDLRPSGRAGVLVSSFNSFINYHHIDADLWEKQALIKARFIAGDPKFGTKVNNKILELVYETPNPLDLKNKINDLRIRMQNERASETATKLNIKLGSGGLMDIEAIVQYLQLSFGEKNKSLRTNNTPDAINLLVNYGELNESEAKNLIDGYYFLKILLSRIRLFANHATDYLNTEQKILDQIAKSLDFESKSRLLEDFLSTRDKIRNIYNKIFSNYSA